MGTFCEDGSFTLPIGKPLILATSQLILVEYSMPGKGEISFSYKVDCVQRTSAIHNPCNFVQQQYAFYRFLDISEKTVLPFTSPCSQSQNYGHIMLINVEQEWLNGIM